MISVLHAIPSVAAHHGGPSVSVAGLLNALSETGLIRTSLICGPDQVEPALSGLSARHDMAYASSRFWLPKAKSLRVMARAIDQADLIHVHSYWNGFAALMVALAHRAGKPIVLSPRGCLHADAMAQSSQAAKRVFAALGGKRQLKQIAGFHFQTEDEAKASIGRAGRPSIILDNGVALPEPNGSRCALFGQTQTDPNLVFLGRIARIKGIDLQVKAIALLQGQGIRAHLHLVGPDGGDLTRLIALAKTLGVSDQLHTHGPVFSDTKYQWLRAADAVLMSSEFENNSNAALEAMAAGGVLIGTEGCIPDGPVQAQAARRVARSAEALAEAIRHRSDTRDAARYYVRLNHDWASRAHLMLAFYEKLL
nr:MULTISPECIES: glycosyltransferase [unclassified Ruegeria]